MEWSESKIVEFVNQGWSLSWDKTNQRYKLQKRINGRVKSYTLPKEYYRLRLSLTENSELCFVLYHILTPDVFAIKKEDTAGIVQYEFNERVHWLIEDLKVFIQSTWPRILEIIEKNEISKP